MRSIGFAVPALLVSALAAQTTIVSPVGLATTEGSSSNAFPFTNTSVASTRRYMQIHSDLVGTPMAINKLSFRMNGTASSFAGSAVCDMELNLGDSRSYDRPSWVFAGNWLGTPATALTRTNINFGPLTAGTPAPFEFNIPLTTPWVYSGVTSFAWEAVVHSLALTAPFASAMDVDPASIVAGAAAVDTGPGCIATGQTLAMSLAVTHADTTGTWAFGCAVDRGPASAPTFLYLGTSNPNTAFPGLCGNLYTDLVLSLPLGATDATGFSGTFSNVAGTTKTSGGANVFALPNSIPGVTIFMQAHALDVGQPGLPIANSNGMSVVVPTPNNTKIRQITRLLNNFGGVTQTDAIFFNTTNIGHGAVTEFTF